MRLLLDTHTFLWFIEGSPLLSRYARRLIGDVANERFLSIASLFASLTDAFSLRWEMAIKASIGKLRLSLSFAELVVHHVQGNAIQMLQIEQEHLDVLRTLPFYHKDPFDRLIISQGLSEHILVLSRDEVFDDYGIQRLWNE